MDSNLRTLLSVSQQYGPVKGNPSLQEAYDILRNVAEVRPAVDAPDSFGQDLYVLCAETAFQHGHSDMAKACLKMYFMRTPPANQFLCRAYLCQAQLLAPRSADNPEQLDKAVVYLLKAINMAKEHQRYHFLVYNASVIYWQFSRPFLKPSYKQFLAQSLHQVVKALDDIDDKDYEWRAQLMIALIECHMDAGHKNDASHIATASAAFVRQNVPGLYKTLFGLMTRHQLIDSSNAKIQSEMKASSELSAYHKLCKLKLSVEQKDSEKNVAEEMRKILAQVIDKQWKSNKNDASMVSQEKERMSLLLELGRLASEQDLPDIGVQCAEYIKERLHLTKDQGFFLEVEFLQCELMVRSLQDKQHSYHKSYVDIRLQSIKRCNEAILSAVRNAHPNVIQAGCTTQWNLCMPLLQPNLRRHVRKPLTLVAEALEDIQSLLIRLRCQVHTELAKCEEDVEQIEVAMQHLKKALALDDGSVYQERLQLALHRLELRAELYKQPERLEDQAAMIIEQARKANSGTMRMKRSLLVKAGQALAPDAFLLVLESESDSKEASAGRGPLTQIKRKAGKAQQFKNCVKKAEGHLRRLGDENDRERAQLWGDLAKTARKQEVWDVCRVAARFCLLYDDGRWKIEQPAKEATKPQRTKSVEREATLTDGPEAERSTTDLNKSSSRISKDAGSRPTTPEKAIPLYDKDLVRMMAEVRFINGEALIHLLRTEGLELGDKPIPPTDKSKRPKGYKAKKPEDDPDWLEYTDWTKSLTTAAVDSFLRAIALGIQLKEPWIVCSSSSYVWNYINHILEQNRHSEFTGTLESLLDGIRQVGHAGETILLVDICNALAVSLIQPWLPSPQPEENAVIAPSPRGDKSPTRNKSPKRGGAKSQATTKAKPSGPSVTISSDATPDLKKAVEVCDYALRITNGDRPANVVPIANRLPLLQTWAKAKQMLQAPIGKGLGTQDETDDQGQNPLTRAMVAVEMLQLNRNGIAEFRDTPPLAQTVEMVGDADWTDKLIELQMWSRLTYLAHATNDHKLVSHCAQKALAFAEAGTQPKGKKQDHHKYVVEQELLSFASSLYGQSLVANTQGKNSIRRKAMEQFLYSAQFACKAQNGELVMLAARRYWNACLPLIKQPIERELVKGPLTALLQCISDTTDKSAYKKPTEDEEEDEEEEEDVKEAPPKPADVVSSSTSQIVQKSESAAEVKPSSKNSIGDPEDDLTLRACLYGVLFQSYADKGEWEAGLQAMDKALADMPRTSHRLLIFKHLVIVKAKLGQNVSMSIQKFKDESEDYVANMWRSVALCSAKQAEQLQGYQNAIEALTLPSNDWQKVDLLVEFGQWLYCNELPLDDIIGVLEWAADILLNMSFEEAPKPEGKVKKSKSQKKLKTPPESAKGFGKTGKRKSVTDSKKNKDNAGKKTPVPNEPPQPTNQSGDAEVEEHGDLVPTEKEVIIGCPPKNPALAVNDLRSVQQLEGLFRINVLNAQIAGRSSAYFADYCLMAYTYVVRMWQVSLGSAGPVIKELAKNSSPEPATKGAPGKGKDKKEAEKEKPKRKGPLDAIPRNTEEWAAYDAPDEVLEAFKQDSMKICGINSSTITKPSLTVFYLETLCRQLQELGYHHLALPVLAMGDAVARLILESKPAAALIHLKAMEVCVQLNLIHAAHFHETLGNIELDKEEQAKSQEEIRQWKEKQIQVRNEELRIRESLARLRNTESKKSQADKDFQQKLSDNDQLVNHLGRELGAVKFRDVWTESAEVLLRNAMYQPARDMLNEAYQAATAFEDHILAARVLYLLGRLSFSEAQYGQAVSFCFQAQKLYDGDEMFWYETVMLVVDATLADYQVKQQTRRRKAEGILINSLSVFKEIADCRPNKQNICQFVLSKLEAKLGSIEAARTLNDNLSEPGVIASLLKACERLQKAGDDLVSLGYRREALGIFKERAKLYATLARESGLTTDKHAYYVTTLDVLESARQVAAAVWQDVQSLSSIQEMKQISSPAQRELAELNLLCAEMMLEMFEIHVHEMRDKQVEDQRKGSVLRAVEELVRETPDYSSSEQRWIDYTDHLADKALATLNAAHSLGTAIPQLKARALFNSGRCLHLLADLKGPDSPGEWEVQSLETLGITQGFEKEPLSVTSSQPALDADTEKEADDTTSVKEEFDTTSPENVKYTQALGKLQGDSNISNAYMVQATECLTQAVNLALSKGLKEIAASAALELVECLGQFDPSLASQYLALHQSCQASLHMQAVLTQALLDPTVSQQAALLHQLQTLRANSISSNLDNGPIMKSIANTLQNSSKAWSRLEVMPQHLDLLKEFPPNFNLVILQHSPDKSHLYGAVLDKPKPGVGGGKSKGNAALQASSAAKVVRIATSAEQLQQLLDRCRGYKTERMQMLLKMEYQYSLFAQRDKMLANLESEDKPKQSDSRIVIEEDFEETCKRLDADFEQLVSEIDSYLKPLMSQLDQILRPPSSTTVSNAKDGKKEESPQEYVVLLADQFLLELPLEALPVLQAENVVSLTRDISVQMLYHKLHVEVADEPEKDKGKLKNAIPPRIPGLREAGKKQSKIIPLDRPVPQHCIPVDTHGFRYIVDPFQDCSETEQCKPIEVLNTVMEEHSQQFTPRWLGVSGEDHIPSPAEFEIYATEGSAFVFYGMERFCCYLSPSKVASMNLTSCRLAMLYDLAQTSESSLRQSKTDVFKTANVLALEKSVDTALLLSLAGVNCVFLNQWHCTLQDNAERLGTSMRDLLANGKTTGECARLMFTPFRRESSEAEGGKEDKTEEAEMKPVGTEANPEDDAPQTEEPGDQVDENATETVTSQAWYNMVCYGAPNIMVTQLSK